MPAQLLLTTKLSPYKWREHYIKRSRITQIAKTAPDTGLILVSAPAGYGKTTAIGEFCRAWDQEDVKSVWYILDAGDNDPARFAAYLTAAFSRALPETFSENHWAGNNLESAIVHLVNCLVDKIAPCTLILDDYHLIAAPEVHYAVNLLLGNLPPTLRVVIGSRADPPLQLSRLRVRNLLTELRAADLRFTPEEISTFFETTLRVRPSEATTRLLETSTEGWPVGLQLASIVLAQRPSAPDDEAIARLARQLSGSGRAIFDYLAEEVFNPQPPELQRFLLNTSIASRFNSALCAVLTGDGFDRPLLRDMDRANLFITPIDQEAGWFRYHHLFGDFLQTRLKQTDPVQASRLHRLAAEWFAQQGDVIEAMGHALAGSDYDLAAQLFTEQCWQPLMARGALVTLLNWITAFPDEVLGRHCRLSLYAGIVLMRVGQKQRAAELLARVEQQLEQADPEDVQAQRDRGFLAAFLALQAVNAGHPRQALELTCRATQSVIPDDPLWAILIARTNGFSQYNLGDMQAAIDGLQTAMQISREIGQYYWLLASAHWLVMTYIKMGALKTAAAVCDELEAAYPADFGPVAYILSPHGIVATEWNDLARVEALFTRSIEMARRERLMDTLWLACVGLARIHLFRRNWEPVTPLLDEGLRAAEALGNEVLMSSARTVNARLWLARGDVNRARGWAEDYLSRRPTDYPAELEDLTLTRIWILLGEDKLAFEQLERIIEPARAAGRNARLIEALVLQTALCERSGQRSAADRALSEALRLGEPEGYLRTFIDHIPLINQPLRRAEAQLCPYVQRILTAHQSNAWTVDSLTERELEVLQLLARGASNQDIAKGLVIGLGTVKSHINHIMSKLDARNRTAAVARARTANLIE